MSMVRCPTCGKKIDTSFYGACLDCGTLLSQTDGDRPAAPVSSPVSSQPVSDQPNSVEDHIARYGGDVPTSESQQATGGVSRAAAIGTSVIIRLVIAGLIIGGGAIWGLFFNADRDDSGVIVDAGSLTPDELRVGDCLDWPGSDSDEIETFDSVDAVPCSDPHDLEVYHLATYPATSGIDFPGNEIILDYGWDACFAQFAGYVGAPWDEVADLDITLFWPSEQSWEDGDRTIHCLIVAFDDGVKLTGTAKGRDA